MGQYPYDGEGLAYDYENHRYRLTPEYVSDQLGLDLNRLGNVSGSTNASAYGEMFLNRISRMVYNYIYEAVMDTETWACMLAKTPSCRSRLKQMMLAQTEYVALGGYSPIMSGINPGTGQVTDINALRGKAKISDEVEQIANQIIPELGVCMRYMGSVNFCFYGGGDW